ncbi:N-acetylmuramoyl-L-alanine amidase [Nonomuraea turkmeniaca]|uniref:N-acetylmuramoyl-L-alanine amidase n=1 Tax=Nonomuraea turkmeniaca TaxID=103838 RepID=A0A5S4FNN6_9ACTN|nr:N-acetylmuramoyl-L-alanine amidase [Nonomuraea turkmeniaca]TMR22357.1 N-acetylmuramoyl-L-alanine amidase [Nonomuraea turkmeniaca]
MRALPASVLAVCGLIASACGGTGSGGAAAGQAAPATAVQEQAPAKDAPPEGKPLDGKVIVIDPGHNGGNRRDPAAINRKVNVLTQWKACDTTGTATNNGYSEAAFTWDVSTRLARILKNRGATVKLTRQNNNGVGPCITERAAIGNKAKADAAISVHADGSAPGNRGFHVIIPKKINGPVDKVVGKSNKLGLAVRDAFAKGTGLPYSTYIGSKALSYRNDLGGLNLSTVPKVFIESGNMRNAVEAAKFQDPKFRQRIALALANGLQHYLEA